MSEQLREILSAVMDGEASQFEARRVLDELRRDARLRADWQRFNQVSALLQGASAGARHRLADRVWRDLQDSSPTAPTVAAAAAFGAARPHTWGRLTAVAAALTAVGLLLGVQFTDVGEGQQPGPAQADAPLAASQQPAAAEDSEGMHIYLIEHMQHKAVNHPDVAAMTKLVAFELDDGGP